MNRRDILKLLGVGSLVLLAPKIPTGNRDMELYTLLDKMGRAAGLNDAELSFLRDEIRAGQEVTSLIKSMIQTGTGILYVNGLRVAGGAVVIDNDAIVISNTSNTNDPFIIFKSSDNTTLGRIFTNSVGNLEIDAFGYDVNNEERKLVLRAQHDDGLTNISTIEVISNNDDSGEDIITLSSDVVHLVGDSKLWGSNMLVEQSSTPANPTSGSQTNMYMKADKLVFQYNHAGTIRYYYLDLTSGAGTWTHTTSAP
jgi:hypothetical protein